MRAGAGFAALLARSTGSTTFYRLALLPGTQDRVSWLVQLAALFAAAAPGGPSAGSAAAGPAKAWRIVLAWVSGVLVFAAIVTGFIIVGSPAKPSVVPK